MTSKNELHNISYSIDEGATAFSYTNYTGDWKESYLQLPTTPDSQDIIEGEDYDCENEAHADIKTQLEDYFYNDFKDRRCALASVVTQSRVQFLVEQDNLIVAFDAEGQAHLLKEGSAADYYHVFYYDLAGGNDLYDKSKADIQDIINAAKKQLLEDLASELRNLYAEELKGWKEHGFIYGGNAKSAKEAAMSYPDEILNGFISDSWEYDYMANDLAEEFYENYATEARIDAENDALAAVEEHEKAQGISCRYTSPVMRVVSKVEMADDTYVYNVSFESKNVRIKQDADDDFDVIDCETSELLSHRTSKNLAMDDLFEYAVDPHLTVSGYGIHAGRKFWQLPQDIQDQVYRVSGWLGS